MTDHQDTAETGAEEATGVAEPPARRGDVEKCPVCGARVDPESYYCPTCSNYFCFHCRARVSRSEEQLQCVTPSCAYYGKLLCLTCSPEQEREEAPSVYEEPVDGYWPAWLLLVLAASGLVWHWSSFAVAFFFGLVTFGVGGYFIHRRWLNLFGSKRVIEQVRRTSFNTCVYCGDPAKRVTDLR